MSDQAYKEKVRRELFEAIWAFQNSIDASEQDEDQALAQVIVEACAYPSIVAGTMSDILEAKKNIEM